MNLFTHVIGRKPKTNKIPLSFQNTLTTGFGRLVPTLVEECVPGDVFRVQTEVFTRFMPLMAPILQNCRISVHNFFVPTRVLFRDFYAFLADEPVPGEKNVPVVPFSTYADIFTASDTGAGVIGSLMDYLNLPTHLSAHDAANCNDVLNMLPFLAYHKIWFDYYRDENLDDVNQVYENALLTALSGGDVTALLPDLCSLHWRNFKKDYFTSALPWPQKGQDVLLPISGAGFSLGVATTAASNGQVVYNQGAAGKPVTLYANNAQTTDDRIYPILDVPTINELRKSFRVQELIELNARGGTRQKEIIWAHFGVDCKDARLQRAEYIGGSTSPIQISEVLSQAGFVNQDTDSALGSLGGHGVSGGYASSKKYRVTEHGYLMQIVSVMPDQAYFQGIPRKFLHLDKYDYYWPSLAHLGEQEIQYRELALFPAGGGSQNPDPEEVFGYTPRYAEYKYHPNEIHGDLRNTLSFWHASRVFGSTPKLNNQFTNCIPSNQDLNRIFTYENEEYDKILVQLTHHNGMLRKMPYFGTPRT